MTKTDKNAKREALVKRADAIEAKIEALTEAMQARIDAHQERLRKIRDAIHDHDNADDLEYVLSKKLSKAHALTYELERKLSAAQAAARLQKAEVSVAA